MSVQTLSSPISSSTSYTRVAKILHWLVALFILANFAMGLRMEYFPGYAHTTPEWKEIFFWHGSIGALVLWLALARIIWRAGHQPPALPASVPAWQKWAAHGVHALLYVTMLALPLSGYVHRVAGNNPVSFFGLWNWPSVLSRDEPLRVQAGEVHLGFVIVLGCLLLLHFGAAIKHLLIDRDDVVKRML